MIEFYYYPLVSVRKPNRGIQVGTGCHLMGDWEKVSRDTPHDCTSTLLGMYCMVPHTPVAAHVLSYGPCCAHGDITTSLIIHTKVPDLTPNAFT